MVSEERPELKMKYIVLCSARCLFILNKIVRTYFKTVLKQALLLILKVFKLLL